MTDYRIAPHGFDLWKVQEKFLWWFWLDVTTSVAYGLIERVTFMSEAQASEWIDRQIVSDAIAKGKAMTAKERKRTIRPRTYP